MRVCPKCGYIDLAIWKHIPFSYYLDGCSYENFQIYYPKMAKQIVNGIVEDKHYNYKLTRNKRWVQRKAKIDYDFKVDFERTPDTKGGMTLLTRQKRNLAKRKDWGQGEDHRQHWARNHPNQAKLLETTPS